MVSVAVAEGVAAVVTAAAATYGTVETIHARNMAARQQANQARSQINQLKIAQKQKQAQRTQTMIKSIGDSSVQEMARNVSLASPTFQAAQADSYRQYQSDKSDSMLNTVYRTNTLQQQIDQMNVSRDVGNAQSVYSLGKYFGGALDLYSQEAQQAPKAGAGPKPKKENQNQANPKGNL